MTIGAAVRAYYRALEEATPLAPFFAADWPDGPVVKIGTEPGEVYVGAAAVAAELERVQATLTDNRLRSRRLLTWTAADVGWFFDEVWWSGRAEGRPFAGLTLWTGVLRRAGGPRRAWRFVLLHVSEPQRG